MEGTFSSRVWELAISIPAGRVTSYGAIAKAAGVAKWRLVVSAVF